MFCMHVREEGTEAKTCGLPQHPVKAVGVPCGKKVLRISIPGYSKRLLLQNHRNKIYVYELKINK